MEVALRLPALPLGDHGAICAMRQSHDALHCVRWRERGVCVTHCFFFLRWCRPASALQSKGRTFSPPPRAPPQPGRARHLSPAFGLLVAIRRPCTSVQGPAWVNEVRSDAAPRDQPSEAVHVVFIFEQKTNFHGGGGPRPNIKPRVSRLNGLTIFLCRQSSRRSSGGNTWAW